MPVDVGTRARGSADRAGSVRRLTFLHTDDGVIRRQVREQGLDLTVDEAKTLTSLLGRDPTLLEAHLFNTMWSEHCSYKSSKPILKKYLPTDSPFVILGPVEDAGIVEIGEHEGIRYAAVIGHESHNHPSQIVPYEGAATGIGGIVRDVYCMGADVFGVLDSLRFGDVEGPNAERCREIMTGVVDGIAGYANPLGVPNLGGETVFHPGYDDNCLVNVIAAGVVRAERVVHSAAPEAARREPFDFILVGKGTDSTGFGGAAMASRVLDEKADQRSAVQVPDPFLKRVLRNATLAVVELAASRGIEVGLKDLGAGGIACCSSEMAHAGSVGIELDLDAVHVQEPGLPPEVIACAETQERFGWMVPSSFTADVLRVFNETYELGRISRSADARVVGRVLPHEQVMRVFFRGEVVGEMRTADITAGVRAERETAAPRVVHDPQDVHFDGDLRELALRVLASCNVASKRELFSHYDQEVRGQTYFRAGEADAGVCAPVPGAGIGVAIACDGNPYYGDRDPYWGGANAVLEAVRKVVATGARPRALTDCLNFGNPQTPEVYRDFVEAVRGMADAARGIGTLELEAREPLPFVSGNVSFYNESSSGRAVPPSAIVSCLGVLADASQAVGLRLNRAGNRILLLGEGRGELGGSEVAILLGQDERGAVPSADFETERNIARALLRMVNERLVAACHHVSSGGLLTTLAEMMLGAWGRVELGLEVNIATLPGRGDFERLFSESGAYVVELESAVPQALSLVPHFELGRVIESPELRLRGSEVDLRFTHGELEKAWSGSFREVMS